MTTSFASERWSDH